MTIHVEQKEMFKNSEMNANPYFGLSLPHLADIRENIKKEIADAQKRLAHAEQAIELAVECAVLEARRFHNKPEGTIHVVVEDCDVKHTVPKRISWDQEKLASACQYIENLGYAAADFGIKRELVISEKAWNEMPVKIAEIVRDSRTLKHGKAQIEITPTE